MEKSKVHSQLVDRIVKKSIEGEFNCAILKYLSIMKMLKKNNCRYFLPGGPNIMPKRRRKTGYWIIENLNTN